MNVLLSGAAMLLPLFVLGHAGAAVCALIFAFFGLPLGWALAVSIFCFWLAASGYKMMQLANAWSDEGRRSGVNGVAGLTIATGLLLAVPIWFVLAGAAHRLSQWWALLLPLGVAGAMLFQALVWQALNIINPPASE